MALALQRRRFTVDEYLRMWKRGIFDDEDRLELIEGEIYVLPPPGPPHASTTSWLDQILTLAVGRRAIVWGQNPVRIGDWSLPQPDVMLLRAVEHRYGAQHPRPEDALLVVEVADSTESKDRRIKMPLYARAGIPEYWLVLVRRGRVEVHRAPGPDGYGEVRLLQRGDTLSPLAFPDVTLSVDEVLGPRPTGA